MCESQEEVDHYWEKLSAGGAGQAQQCGWLKDKFGVSWQIVPTALPTLLGDKDRTKAEPRHEGAAADEEARHRGASARALGLKRTLADVANGNKPRRPS